MICKGNNSTVTHLMSIVPQWSVLNQFIVDIYQFTESHRVSTKTANKF